MLKHPDDLSEKFKEKIFRVKKVNQIKSFVTYLKAFDRNASRENTLIGILLEVRIIRSLVSLRRLLNKVGLCILKFRDIMCELILELRLDSLDDSDVARIRCSFFKFDDSLGFKYMFVE